MNCSFINQMNKIGLVFLFVLPTRKLTAKYIGLFLMYGKHLCVACESIVDIPSLDRILPTFCRSLLIILERGRK